VRQAITHFQFVAKMSNSFLCFALLCLVSTVTAYTAHSAETVLASAAASNATMAEEDLRKRIEEIKAKSQAGGMEKEEYFLFQNYVNTHPGQKLLVWGLGYDSVTINELNKGGETRFMEFDTSWVDKTNDEALKALKWESVNFDTSIEKDGGRFLESPHGIQSKAMEEQPCWNTVLIDSPTGFTKEAPGRFQSFHQTATMAENCIQETGQPITVFAHDNNRPIEEEVGKAYFGEQFEEVGPKKLRKWTLGPGYKINTKVLKAKAEVLKSKMDFYKPTPSALAELAQLQD